MLHRFWYCIVFPDFVSFPTFIRKNRKYYGTIPSLLVLFNAIDIFLVGTCGAKCNRWGKCGEIPLNEKSLKSLF